MNKHNIILKDVNKGELLIEAVRAFLHQGNASSMLLRIQTGIKEHIEESNDKKNKAILMELEVSLRELSADCFNKESI